MRILFLGPPGSGKGTQSKKLAEKENLLHLSSGDLLRATVAAGTPAGKAAKPYMDDGKLVPDPVLIDMFREQLSNPGAFKGFILDGFPRNISQAQSLDAMLAELMAELDTVLNLEIDNNLLQERITGRRSCPNKACGAVYHIKFAPPKKDNVCDLCGTQLIQRSDDNADLVAKRLKTYNEETAPLIEYYTKKGLLKKVDAEGKPNEVFAHILESAELIKARK
jgi:adenylate kinase